MSAANHVIRWLPCYMCGSLILTSAPRVTYPECRAECHRARSRARYRPYKPDPDAYIIVNDPDETCGFRKGAVINREQLRLMLTAAYEAFTPGTTLTNKDGEMFKIVRVKRGGLKLLNV